MIPPGISASAYFIQYFDCFVNVFFKFCHQNAEKHFKNMAIFIVYDGFIITLSKTLLWYCQNLSPSSLILSCGSDRIEKGEN